MPRPKKLDIADRVLTNRQQNIKAIQSIPRHERDADAVALLATLQAEERRDRFVRLMPKRITRLKGAVRQMVRMGNPKAFQYTEDEAQAIITAVKSYTVEIERSFRGAPKEKGLFDL